MTYREHITKLMPVIEAFSKGESIQCRSALNGTWTDITEPTWHRDVDWRIKPPPPRECWINRVSLASAGMFRCDVYASLEEATRKINIQDLVHFREVASE